MQARGKSFARLQLRLTLLLSVVFCLLLIAYNGLTLVSSHPRQISDHAQYAYSLTQFHLSDAITIYDGNVASNIIRSLENDPAIYRATIKDIDGIILSSFSLIPEADSGYLFQLHEYFDFEETFDFNIRNAQSEANAEIGVLSINVNSYKLFLREAALLPITILETALWTILIIVIVSVVIYFRIAKPITDLSKLVDGIDLQSVRMPDFTPVRKSASYEIQILCSTIYTMLLNIQRKLEEKNSEVEGFKELSEIDDLTGVANRRAFFAQMVSATSMDSEFSIIYADIDRFKQINDQHGHQAGDAVICATVQAIKSELRDTELLARIGGEEFAIKVPTITPVLVTQVAERIRTAVETNLIQQNGYTLSVTISLGVCLGRENGQDVEQMRELADGALYDAKRAGRNRVSIRQLRSKELDLTH